MREFRQSRLGTLKKINCKFSDLQIISVARDFEQMQEIPPHHFFSPIYFGGYPSPVFQTMCFSAAVQFRSDVSKRVCASSAVPKRSKVCLRSSATFVPFGRVFSYPSPHPIIVSQIFAFVNKNFKKIQIFYTKKPDICPFLEDICRVWRPPAPCQQGQMTSFEEQSNLHFGNY